MTNGLVEKFTGTGIAVITPFLENGAVDWASLERLTGYWIDNHIDYLVVMGTTGESATIRQGEKQEIFSFVARQVNGRVPLMAGIGGNDTASVTEALNTTRLSGYEAVLSVSPYYNKPGQEGIYQHYRQVSQQSPLPVLLYNVPGRTGQNITADTTLRLAHDCPNIFGIKEASGDFEQISRIVKHAPEGFMVISGNDSDTLPMMACGARGLISVAANAFPEDFARLVSLCLNGRFAEALPLHLKYVEVIHSLFSEGNPAGIKEYMAHLGLCKHYCRLPVVPVSEAHSLRIQNLLMEIATPQNLKAGD